MCSSSYLALLLVLCLACVATLTTQAAPIRFLTSNAPHQAFAVMANNQTTVRFSSSHNITYPGDARCAGDAIYDPNSGEVLADERCYIDFVIENYHSAAAQLPLVRSVDCILYDMTHLNYNATQLNLTQIYAKTTSAFAFSTPAEETITPAQYDAEKNAIIYRHFLNPDLFFDGAHGDLTRGQYFQLHCEVTFDKAGYRPENDDSTTWEQTFFRKSPVVISLNGAQLLTSTFAWGKSINAAENTRYLPAPNADLPPPTTTIDETVATLLPREADPTRRGDQYVDRTQPINVGFYSIEQELYTLYDWRVKMATNFVQQTLAKATTTQSPWTLPMPYKHARRWGMIYNGPGVFVEYIGTDNSDGCMTNDQPSQIARGGGGRLDFHVPHAVGTKHLSFHCSTYTPLYIPKHLNAASYAPQDVPKDKFLTNPTMTTQVLHELWDADNYQTYLTPTHALTIPIKAADQQPPQGDLTTPYNNVLVNPIRAGVDMTTQFAPNNTTIVASFQLAARNFTHNDEFTVSFSALGVTTADLVEKKAVQIWISPYSGQESFQFVFPADSEALPWGQHVFFEPNITLYDHIGYKEVLTNVTMDGAPDGVGGAQRTTTQVLTNDIKFNPWEMFIKHPENLPHISATWRNDLFNVGFDITVVFTALTVDTTHDVLELEMTALYQNTAYSVDDNAKQVKSTGIVNVPILGALKEVQKKQGEKIDLGVFRFSDHKGMRMYINNPQKIRPSGLAMDLMGATAWGRRDVERAVNIEYSIWQWSTSSTAEGKTGKYRNNGITFTPTRGSAARHGSTYLPSAGGSGNGDYLHLDRVELDFYGAVPKQLSLLNRADPTGTAPRPLSPIMVTWFHTFAAPIAEGLPMIVFIDPMRGDDGEAVTTAHGSTVDTKFTKMSNNERRVKIVEDYDESEMWVVFLVVAIVVPCVVGGAILLFILLCIFKKCQVCCWANSRKGDYSEQELAH